MTYLRPFLILIVVCVISTGASAPVALGAPHIVVDLKSGKVLDQQEAFDRWYPASLTKLMTAYTVFREIKKGKVALSSPVLVSANALSKPPSRIGYPLGSVLSIDNALKILMVKSANDMAVAVAESVAGSESGFVELMNANARDLGMSGSHFVNPHGLHDEQQYTTARDLAVLAMALRKEFPEKADYFDIPAISVGGRAIANHNQLLFRYPGTTGMKTGFVCASGLNVVVTARRGLRELIAVVLGGPTGQERNVRAAKLLNDGFAKNSFFVATKLDKLRPTGFVKVAGTDLGGVVCKPRAKTAKKDAAQKSFALAFADDSNEDNGSADEASLDELELKLLGPKPTKLPAGRVVKIALGDATGPDPYGLIAEGARLSEIRQAAEAEAAARKKANRAKKNAAKSKKSKKQAKK